MSSKTVHTLDRVVIRFAGDSGDGMQLTGDRFTSETAALGNDLSTLPNFPAEIRAPQGTLPGVSSFQLHFADHDVLTPGDAPDVLVAMNPAALKANLGDLPRGATIIVNTDEFTKPQPGQGRLRRPARSTTARLDSFHVHPVALTSITVEALADFPGLTRKEKERAKNMFALGLLSWMYTPPDHRHRGLPHQQVRRPARHPRGQPRRPARRLELRRDHRGLRRRPTSSPPRRCRPAPTATSPATPPSRCGLVAAAHRAGLPLVLGSYPITPASDILHALAALKRLRRHDHAGRGRDRRHRRRPRRQLRRRHRRHHHLAAPASP